jgi:lysine-N-methylase
MLTPESLCRIHAEMGQQALPMGCSLFPRIRHNIDGVTEESLNAACPTAAGLVMLQQELFRPFAIPPADALAALMLQCSPVVDLRLNFWPLRTLSLALLLDRSLPVASRLSRLVLLAQCLGSLNLQPFLRQLETPHLPSAAEPPGFSKLLPALDQLLNSRPDSRSLRQLVLAATGSLGYHPNLPTTHAETTYRQAWQQTLAPFLDAHPWLLENYLANHIFLSLFPLGWLPARQAPPPGPASPRPAPSALAIALELSRTADISQGLLTGLAAMPGLPLTQALVVTVAQVVTRARNQSLTASLQAA